MTKHAPRLSRRALFLTLAIALVVAVTSNAYAASKRASDARTTQGAVPRASVTKQVQLAPGSPTSTLFNVRGVARIGVTCTVDQSSTGVISNGLNVAIVNTGKVDLPLVFSRANERPPITETSGDTVTPGGAHTELFSPNDSIDNAHSLRVQAVANRRLTLDLTALTKHTPTGGCLVNATLTT